MSLKDIFSISNKYGFDDSVKSKLSSSYRRSLKDAFDIGEKYGIKDDVMNRISNYQDRISAAGATVPQPEDNRNWVLKTLDFLDKPRNAIWNAVQDKYTGENGFFQGLKEGWNQTERVSGTDVINSVFGTEDDPNAPWYKKLGKGAAGIALEVAGDPLTYATLGVGGLVKGALTGVGKAVGKETGTAVAKAVTGGISKDAIRQAATESLQKQGVKNITGDAIEQKAKDLALIEAKKVADKYGFDIKKLSPKLSTVEDVIENTNKLLTPKLEDFYSKMYKPTGLGVSVPFTKVGKEFVSGETMRELGVKSVEALKKIPLAGTAIERAQTAIRNMTDGLAVFTGLAAPQAVVAKQIVLRAKGQQAANEKASVESIQDFVRQGVKKYGKEEFDRMDNLVYKVLEGTVDEKELTDDFRELVFGKDGLIKRFDKIKKEEFDAGILRTMVENYFPKVPKLQSMSASDIAKGLTDVKLGKSDVEKKLSKGGFTEKLKIFNPSSMESKTGSTLSIANRFMRFKTSDEEIKDAFVEKLKSILPNEVKEKYGNDIFKEVYQYGDAFERLIKEVPKDKLDELLQPLNGIQDFFETSFTKALLIRELRSGKVLADKQILNDLTSAFGERVYNKIDMLKKARDGKDIIIPKSSLNAIYTVVPDKDMRTSFSSLNKITDKVDEGNAMVDKYNISKIVSEAEAKTKALAKALNAKFFEDKKRVKDEAIANTTLLDLGSKYSDDIQAKIDNINSRYDRSIEVEKNTIRTELEKQKAIKGLNFRRAAEIREAVQGDSLARIQGGLTNRELEKLRKPFRTGTRVIYDGKEAEIIKPKGKWAEVKFDDGTTANIEVSKITRKEPIEDVIKRDEEAAKLLNQKYSEYEEKLKAQRKSVIDKNIEPIKKAKKLAVSDLYKDLSKLKKQAKSDYYRIPFATDNPVAKGQRAKITINNTDILVGDTVVGKASKELAAILNKWSSSDESMIRIDPRDYERFIAEVSDIEQRTGGRFNVAQNIIEAYAMPKGTIEYINTSAKNQLNSGIMAVQNTLDSFLRIWKPLVTVARPVYYLRNIVGGNLNNFMDIGFKVLDPKTQADAAKIMANRPNSKIELGGKEYDVNQIKNAMIKRGALQGFQADEFSDTRKLVEAKLARAEQGDVGFSLRNPLEATRDVTTKLGRGIETQIRAVNFVANVRKALDEGYPLELAYDYAGEQVRKFQFDYTDITEAERTIFRRIVPFYTWMRKNVPLQLEKALNDPSFIATFEKAQRNLEQSTGTDLSSAPAWLKESLAAPVDTNKILDFSIPQKDLTTTVARPIDTIITSLNPILKAPLEIMNNKNFLTGAPLYKNEAEKNSQLGKYILGQTGIINDLVQTGRDLIPKDSQEEDKPKEVETKNKILKALLSGTIKDYNPEQAEINRLYDYNRQLGNKVQELRDQDIQVPTAREAEKILDPRTSMLSRRMRELLKSIESKNGGL